MKNKILLPAALVFILTACGPDNGGGTQAAPAASSVSAAPPAPAAEKTPHSVQTLESSDRKIRIMVEDGRFNDVIGDSALRPETVSENELTLLRQDPEAGILIYAVNLGAAQTDAKTYFANLKTALESAQNMENLRIGIATDNRMNYQFVQEHSGVKLAESCIAIHEKNLYTVCAASPAAAADQLASVLKDVNIIK